MAVNLVNLISDSLPDSPRKWFLDAVAEARVVDKHPGALAVAFAGTERRSRALGGHASEKGSGMLAVAGASTACWGPSALVRAALLLEAAEACPDKLPSIVESLFLHGDNEERTAILKVLALLPDPGRFRDLAVEACRTNVLDVFEAIACENPYPARYLSEAAFNQMTLKAMFLGVGLDRIDSLAQRANTELARMGAAYASERRRAGRSVPADIGLLETGTGKES